MPEIEEFGQCTFMKLDAKLSYFVGTHAVRVRTWCVPPTTLPPFRERKEMLIPDGCLYVFDQSPLAAFTRPRKASLEVAFWRNA